MLNAPVVRAFADLLPDVPDPRGPPNVGKGADRGACWDMAGVQCEEMEYLWRNHMQRGSLFLSCFSLHLGKSLSALLHDTKFGSCGDYCVRRLLKISSFQQMKKQ